MFHGSHHHFSNAEYELPAVFGFCMVDSVKGIFRRDIHYRRSHPKTAVPPKRQSAVLQSHGDECGGDQCARGLHPAAGCTVVISGCGFLLLFTCNTSLCMPLTERSKNLRERVRPGIRISNSATTTINFHVIFLMKSAQLVPGFSACICIVVLCQES